MIFGNQRQKLQRIFCLLPQRYKYCRNKQINQVVHKLNTTKCPHKPTPIYMSNYTYIVACCIHAILICHRISKPAVTLCSYSVTLASHVCKQIIDQSNLPKACASNVFFSFASQLGVMHRCGFCRLLKDPTTTPKLIKLL